MRIRLSMLCLLTATTAACGDADFFSGHWPGNNASGSNFANLPNNHSISEQALNALGTPLGSGVQLPAIEQVVVHTSDDSHLFNSLQDAIDFAQPGYSLELRYGPYLGPYTIDDKHGIAIYGTTGLHQRRIDGRGEDRGLVITNSSNITIENLKFTNCTCDTDPVSGTALNGGAIAARWTTGLHLGDCVFSGNRALLGSGGAVEARECSDVSFSACLFRDNFSNDSGGAIRALCSTELDLTDCTFLSNTSMESGGAIRVFSCGADASDWVRDCVFFDNSASHGGALSLDVARDMDGWIMIDDCTLVGNRAVGVHGSGGAMELAGYASVAAIDSTFMQHRAAHAAVANLVEDANLDMIRCGLVGNRTSNGRSEVEAWGRSEAVVATPAVDCATVLNTPLQGNVTHSATQTHLDHCGYTADLTLDGEVNMHDLMALLHQWGPAWRQRADIANTPGGPLDRVDATDLVAMLEAWGEQAPPPLD